MLARPFLFATLTLWIFCSSAGDLEFDLWAEELFNAMERGPIDGVSSIVPEIDLQMAKKLQRSFVSIELENKTIGGYKAGFTNPLSQKKWGLSGPVSGVLVDEYGWLLFFLITFLAAIPGLVLLWKMRKYVESLEEREDHKAILS